MMLLKQISQIKDQVSGRTEQFSYDLNGNIAQRSILNIQLDYNWDEENRLRSFTKKDKLSETTHLYYYDASGERIMKIKAAAAKLYQNSDLKSSELLLRDYTVYPSAFITQSDLKTTKHYYAGSKRIASRIEMKPATEPRLALDSELKLKQETDLEAIAKKLGCDKFKYEFSQYDAESEDTEDTALRADVSSIFFYHPDHLGTSTVVSNASGTLHQYFFNLPFGETMIEGCTNSTYQLNYKFNAKELDAESGMYYYGARYYDPRISVWMSVDPIFQKNPKLSPFVYCSNHPMNKIDPDGRDDYEFNKKGKLVRRIENKNHDAVHLIDSDGNRVISSDNFAYGTIKHNQPNVKVKGKPTKLDILTIQGDANATQIFEMFADNGDVEWTHAKIGKEGSGKNIVGTSHSDESTAVGHYLRLNRYTLKEVTHNHPNDNPLPSGIKTFEERGEKTNDLRGAELYKQANSNIKLNIYTKYCYSPYDDRGTLDSRISKRDGQYIINP